MSNSKNIDHKNKQPSNISAKRVGFLLQHPYSGKGGTENALINIVNGLRSLGIDVHIFYVTPFVSNGFLENLPNPIFLQEHIKKKKMILKVIPGFLRKYFKEWFFRQSTLKIINKVMTPLNLDALIILDLPHKNEVVIRTILEQKKAFNTPKIFSWLHALNSDLSIQDQKKFKEILLHYDGHLAVSKAIQSELKNVFDLKNIHLIYNPIQSADLIDRDHKKFLFIGRIVPIKQLPQLLQMIDKLTGNWSLDIYGTTGTSEGDDEFQKEINILKCADKIHFHGWVNDPWDKIDSAGVLILNSIKESFGLVLAEAMMRGIPCVSVNSEGGPKEIIQNSINGWLFPPNDEKYFINLMQDIIDKNILLPSPQSVRNSVLKFETSNVTRNFLNSLE